MVVMKWLTVLECVISDLQEDALLWVDGLSLGLGNVEELCVEDC